MSIQTVPNVLIRDQGTISFYDKTWTVQYDINMDNYFKNAETLLSSKNKLLQACEELEHKEKCKLVIDNFDKDFQTVKINLKYIREILNSKKKRWIVALSKILFQILTSKYTTLALNAGSAGYLVYNYLDKPDSDFALKSLSERKEQLLREYRFLQATEKDLVQIKKEEKFENLRLATGEMLAKHVQNTATTAAILVKQARLVFFNIIDISKFNTEIIDINKKLGEEFHLPDTDAIQLLEISLVESYKNNTHIGITVDIPILPNDTLHLKELVPIPYEYENYTKILNINSLYYYTNGSGFDLISKNILDECIHVSHTFICSSNIISDMFVDACVIDLLEDDEIKKCGGKCFANVSKCESKIIPSRNYILHTSDHSVFCYIVTEMALRVRCGKEATIHNFTHSEEIEFDEHCSIYKMTRKRDVQDSMLTNIVLKYDLVSSSNSSDEIETNVGTIHKNEIKTIMDTKEKIEKEMETRQNSPGFFEKVKNRIIDGLENTHNIQLKIELFIGLVIILILVFLAKKIKELFCIIR